MEKHKWLQEIACSFGMEIKQFAKFIGYSRQMLYQVSCGMCKANPGRLAVAMYKLEVENDNMLQKDIETANEMHRKRKKMIEELYDRLTN